MLFVKYVYNIYERQRKYQQRNMSSPSGKEHLWTALSVCTPSLGHCHFLIVLPNTYVSLNSKSFNFACYPTLYKWCHIISQMSFCSVPCLWGSSMSNGFAVVYSFSLLFNMLFSVPYQNPFVQFPVGGRLSFFSFFFPVSSHMVMKILAHVSWCTYPRLSLR